jgi:NAD(P)-dependent dehydrogenase (short-subunit alcohol dehydrogenase family)
MNEPLLGHRILVTGASRGIGRAVALGLARNGAEVVAVATNTAALEALLPELGSRAHAAVTMDVRDESGWRRAQDSIAPNGFLSGVVTAAATLTPIGPIGSWSIQDFRETLDVNVVGSLLAVEANLSLLKDSHGSVAMFSGGGATGPFPRYDAYAASKAAVVRLAENLAAELAADRVRVNAVAPGFVVTDMHQSTLAAGADQVGGEYFDRTARAVASGKGDSPELAASLVSFLMSDESRGISGKLLSARWDPWDDPTFRSRLENDADFATLRRIDDQFFMSVPAPPE